MPERIKSRGSACFSVESLRLDFASSRYATSRSIAGLAMSCPSSYMFGAANAAPPHVPPTADVPADARERGTADSAIEAEPSSQPKLGYCPIRVRAQRFLSCVSGAIREVRCRSPSGPHANLQAVAASVLHRLDKKLAWEAAGNGSLEN
jgi:hypothetical protein